MSQRRAFLLCVCLCPVLSSTLAAQGDDRAGVTATFEAFYAALKSGDRPAAMRTIAPDAV